MLSSIALGHQLHPDGVVAKPDVLPERLGHGVMCENFERDPGRRGPDLIFQDRNGSPPDTLTSPLPARVGLRGHDICKSSRKPRRGNQMSTRVTIFSMVLAAALFSSIGCDSHGPLEPTTGSGGDSAGVGGDGVPDLGTGGTVSSGGALGTGGAVGSGGALGTGGTLGSGGAGGTTVGQLCPVLTTPTNPPGPVPPPPGCACTRRPGTGNSYLCPMGTNETVTASVGSGGGSISLEGQQGDTSGATFRLDIPPGALGQDTRISITETSVPPPSGFMDWSPVYLIEPRGLKLAKVAALRIPWSSNLMGTIPRLAIYEREETGSCQFSPLVDSYTNAGFEQASLTQLGYLIVGTASTSALANCGVGAGVGS